MRRKDEGGKDCWGQKKEEKEDRGTNGLRQRVRMKTTGMSSE